ncbi:MAG: hypothetical protein MHMPM18_002244 [Marteilia pararefringens]
MLKLITNSLQNLRALIANNILGYGRNRRRRVAFGVSSLLVGTTCILQYKHMNNLLYVPDECADEKELLDEEYD